MRRRIDNVEIKEPPIQELQRKRSCLKRSCTTGCGCLILLLIGSLLLLQFATQPRSKEVRAIPTHVSDNLPIYDEDAIERISVTSGKERGKVARRLAVVPKVIASPVLLVLERSSDTSSTTESVISSIRSYLDAPIGDSRDQVAIEWNKQAAKPSFIDNYFQVELKKRKFDITVTSKSDNLRQFSFVHKERQIDGVIYIQDNPDESGTDYVLMTVDIPMPTSDS